MSEFTFLFFIETLIKLTMIIMIGLYFIFSNTIMRVLSNVDNGANVMISINREILNPLFFGCFFISGIGSLVLVFITSTVSVSIASTIFFMGTFVITLFFNVPLNNKLKDALENQINTIWKEYLHRWVFWNHVRTFSGVVSGLLLCL